MTRRTATINVLSQRIDELEREKDRINDAVGKHVSAENAHHERGRLHQGGPEHKSPCRWPNKRLLNQLVKQKNEAGSMRNTSRPLRSAFPVAGRNGRMIFEYQDGGKRVTFFY